jgi:hypothetical protein
MLKILSATILILGLVGILWLAAIVWTAVRSQRSSRKCEARPLAIVSGDDARATLYPYVFVTDEGTVRELHASEKQQLETPFRPCDAARPYVKATYDERNEWGSFRGYCRRAVVPRRLAIGYPPLEDPARDLARQTRTPAHGLRFEPSGRTPDLRSTPTRRATPH